jgi:2-polyprenyl-3-methyl-5-hydroxy-6-metoxy-1,4-benzoquinol methylase
MPGIRAMKREVLRAKPALQREFGDERLEETALPVYSNRLPPASYLGWSRIRHAQRLLGGVSATGSALDFGPGLGVMLPFLAERFDRVSACDEDPDVTRFMIRRLGLSGINVSTSVDSSTEGSDRYDAVLALDVLEHVENLDGVLANLLSVTAENGVWIISGPTMNGLYRLAQKLARTSGEGHIRTIYDIFDAVPPAMRREKVRHLPFGVPLFLIGRFRRA